MLPFRLAWQAEIARMIEIMEEQDRRNEESLATIAQRDAAIDQLSQQVRRRWHLSPSPSLTLSLAFRSRVSAPSPSATA